jgi:hypothetical protein
MKNFRKFVLLFIVLSFVFSCKKENQNFTTKSDFALKYLNGEVIKSLSPDLLVAIHNDLEKKGRNNDAAKLYELYDLKTGILKGADVNVFNQNEAYQQEIDSSLVELDTLEYQTIKSQYEPNSVYAYCHVQAAGDIGPFLQASILNADIPYPYAGTIGQSRRLEGMSLQTESSLLLTRPVIYYSLCNPDNSWTSTATWGQFTGTINDSKAVIGLKIWTTNSEYSIWYKAHNQSTGWTQPWHNDGQFAGIQGKRLEAFAFFIVQY